jgi:6-phosphogluconolactonase (cycloisomerase 2 family)
LIPTAEGVAFAGDSPTDVAVDPSSRFAYVVNRNANTLSMFTIDPNTGHLKPNNPAVIGTEAQPFRVNVDPSGKFVYVTNQASSSVSIYAINSNGTLTSKGVASTGVNPVDVVLIKK